MEFFTNHNSENIIFLIIGTIFALIGLLKLQDLISFSAGLAIILTSALNIFIKINNFSYLAIICLFFTCCIMLSIKKKFANFKNAENKFNDVAGTTGHIYDEEIIKGQIGSIKWSGTIVSAKISENCQQEKFSKNDQIKIVEIKDGIFIITQI